MKSVINYVARGIDNMLYRANDSSRDNVPLAPQEMTLTDARGLDTSLDTEGFVLVPHRSAIEDFADAATVAALHPAEIEQLLLDVTGADAVSVTGTGILRFAEKSQLSGRLDNSKPARFAHVDISDKTAADFSVRSLPEGQKNPRRSVHYNVWRAISPPPQDVPLAICDARSVKPDDLLPAQAVFDKDGIDIWSFEGLVVAHSPQHRWHWFSNMTRDEALIFKTNDSAPQHAHCVPHVAFDNPDCPDDVPPRASVEMRAIAYWY